MSVCGEFGRGPSYCGLVAYAFVQNELTPYSSLETLRSPVKFIYRLHRVAIVISACECWTNVKHKLSPLFV